MFSPKELREESESLVRTAGLVGPEDEGMEIDESYELEEVVQLRSHLSGMRKAIDIVNKGLAKLWLREFPNVRYSDEFVEWYLGQPSSWKVIDPPLYYEWLATLDAERLSKIVSITTVKTTGMTEVEKMTFIEKRPIGQTVTIQNKQIKE